MSGTTVAAQTTGLGPEPRALSPGGGYLCLGAGGGSGVAPQLRVDGAELDEQLAVVALRPGLGAQDVRVELLARRVRQLLVMLLNRLVEALHAARGARELLIYEDIPEHLPTKPVGVLMAHSFPQIPVSL